MQRGVRADEVPLRLQLTELGPREVARVAIHGVREGKEGGGEAMLPEDGNGVLPLVQAPIVEGDDHGARRQGARSLERVHEVTERDHGNAPVLEQLHLLGKDLGAHGEVGAANALGLRLGGGEDVVVDEDGDAQRVGRSAGRGRRGGRGGALGCGGGRSEGRTEGSSGWHDEEPYERQAAQRASAREERHHREMVGRIGRKDEGSARSAARLAEA